MRDLSVVLTNLGNLMRNQGDLVAARPFYEEILAVALRLNDRRAIAMALVNLGPLWCRQGDFPSSRVALSECLTICRVNGL